MKFFQKVNMASESIDSYMRSGIVYDAQGENPIEANGGDLVVPASVITNAVYGEPDENMFMFKAPAANGGLNANLFILDPVKVPEATNGDLVYRMGVRTLGLKVNAGELIAARKLDLNDQFLVGVENLGLTAVPAVGEYYGISDGAVEHAKIADIASTTGYAARVDAIRKISQGIGKKGLVDAVLLTVVRI